MSEIQLRPDARIELDADGAMRLVIEQPTERQVLDMMNLFKEVVLGQRSIGINEEGRKR